ncbi:MAG TPA: hypothetical protein VKA64_10365, partial [Gammaproteobacteria bacterium]|nr:hypothetical protein [Gammaproteobacteria bacterium]
MIISGALNPVSKSHISTMPGWGWKLSGIPFLEIHFEHQPVRHVPGRGNALVLKRERQQCNDSGARLQPVPVGIAER